MQPAADIVYGDCVLSMEDGTSLHRRASRSSLDYGMWSYHQAIFYRREAIGEVRYDPAYPVCADYAFTASLVRRGARVQPIDVTVCRYECGGFSDRNRARLVREHRAIRRDILQVPQPRRALLNMAHAASNLARAYLPALHRALRFGRSGRQG
jgi:putative colanic acid biosynthesis glycosyltransferase